MKKAKKRIRKGKQIERDLATLMQFPGIDLGKLYRGVVEESRAVGDHPGTPAYPYSVELLDQLTKKVLTQELAKAHPDPRVLTRIQRGIQAAEHDRVARYVAESTLGASAMAVDGVNRLLQLRGEIKAEKTSAKTVDNPREAAK